MSKEVVIKSNRYGINLVLNSEAPFEELLRCIGEKFQSSGDFFKNSQMAISFKNRKLTEEEEQKIIDVITQNSTIQIVSIIEDDPILEAKMKKQVEDTLKKQQQQAGADFYKGNLRSGQILESLTDVVLVGDVNPGAKIISTGNIIILGSLKGNAQAGSQGDRRCFIYALEMRPLQLQIGDVIAKSPDKEKGKHLKKKTKDLKGINTSQLATVRENTILLEPVTKNILNKL